MLGFYPISAAPISALIPPAVTQSTEGGGKFYYQTIPHKHREAEKVKKNYSALRAEVIKTEQQIELVNRELEQQALLRQQEALKEYEAGQEMELLTLQSEINRLRIQRDWLMRRLDEEEAIFVILMSLPTIH